MGEHKEPEGISGAKGLEAADELGTDINKDLDASLKNETKAEAALAIIIYGGSWSNAARIAGYSSPFRCRQAVERLLAQTANSTLDRDKMRIVTEKRLNKLLQSVMGKALDPDDPEHLPYNARAFALTDRIARLFGVDAPAQFQITATDERITEWVSRVRQLAGADVEAEEANILEADPDIIDADIIEGDDGAESTG